MNPRMACAAGIHWALRPYCEFLAAEAMKSESQPARLQVKLFKMNTLSPMHIQLKQARKKTASNLKQGKDQGRLLKLPSTDECKAAVLDAMVDLHYVWQARRKCRKFDHAFRIATNVIMMGVIYLNTYAGRPGEWETLTRKAVAEVVAERGTLLKFQCYKTFKIYGIMGRHVPSGTLAAMEKALDIQRASATYFFDTPNSKSLPVGASRLLRIFAEIYTPGFMPPQPTLLRKFFHKHTKLENSQDKQAFAALCGMGKHSVSTALQHYVHRGPEHDAQVAQNVYKSAFGEPVVWPDSETIKERKTVSLDRLRANFAHRAVRRLRLMRVRSYMAQKHGPQKRKKSQKATFCMSPSPPRASPSSARVDSVPADKRATLTKYLKPGQDPQLHRPPAELVITIDATPPAEVSSTEDASQHHPAGGTFLFFRKKPLKKSNTSQPPVSFRACCAGVPGARELAGPEKPSSKKRASSLGGATLFVSFFFGEGRGRVSLKHIATFAQARGVESRLGRAAAVRSPGSEGQPPKAVLPRPVLRGGLRHKARTHSTPPRTKPIPLLSGPAVSRVVAQVRGDLLGLGPV